MTPAELIMSRCRHCRSTFVPRPGACPRCGSTEVVPRLVPAVGHVRAATSLEVPAAGWPTPHPLLLVELAEEVRVLVLGAMPLPAVGAEVSVVRDGELYRVAAG